MKPTVKFKTKLRVNYSQRILKRLRSQNMKKYRSKAYTSPLLDEIIRQNKKKKQLSCYFCTKIRVITRKLVRLSENRGRASNLNDLTPLYYILNCVNM